MEQCTATTSETHRKTSMTYTQMTKSKSRILILMKHVSITTTTTKTTNRSSDVRAPTPSQWTVWKTNGERFVRKSRHSRSNAITQGIIVTTYNFFRKYIYQLVISFAVTSKQNHWNTKIPIKVLFFFISSLGLKIYEIQTTIKCLFFNC